MIYLFNVCEKFGTFLVCGAVTSLYDIHKILSLSFVDVLF